jgi:hypothetical protein
MGSRVGSEDSRAVTAEQVAAATKPYVGPAEIDALMARRTRSSVIMRSRRTHLPLYRIILPSHRYPKVDTGRDQVGFRGVRSKSWRRHVA